MTNTTKQPNVFVVLVPVLGFFAGNGKRFLRGGPWCKQVQSTSFNPMSRSHDYATSSSTASGCPSGLV